MNIIVASFSCHFSGAHYLKNKKYQRKKTPVKWVDKMDRKKD
jgi:hypothetical protein